MAMKSSYYVIDRNYIISHFYYFENFRSLKGLFYRFWVVDFKNERKISNCVMTNHYVIVKKSQLDIFIYRIILNRGQKLEFGLEINSLCINYVIPMLCNSKKQSLNSTLSYFFRVSADIEIKGMDTEKHNEPAYPDIAKGHGYDKEINARLARNSVVPGDIPNLSYGKTTQSDV